MWREHFRLENGFLMREGHAYDGSTYAPCNKKLCITSTSLDAMGELLYALSRREDCWFVKLDAEPLANGMVRGRCFLLEERSVAELWNEYKVTPQFLCTVQDDDWTIDHRPE